MYGSRGLTRARLFLLGGLAVLAAAVAIVLLVPRLVDEEALARRLLGRFETTTGHPVRVLGASRLSLFPEPRLSLGQLEVGESRSGAPALAAAERVEILLSPASLLGFPPAVRELRLVRPRLRLPRFPELADLLVADRALGETLAIESLSIFEGRLTIADPLLPRPLELVGVTLEAVREAERTLFAASGEARLRDLPLAFALESRPGAGTSGTALRLTFGSGAGAVRLGWRGSVAVAGGEPRLAGELELAGDTATLDVLARTFGFEDAARPPAIGAFAARGRLQARGPRLALEGLRLATAAGELEGRLGFEWGPPHRLELELEGSRLVLPEGPLLPLLAEGLWREPPRDLAGSLALRLGALARAGEEIRPLHLAARLPGDGTIVLERLAAGLPGAGDLELEARYDTELAGPGWRGRIALRLGQPRAFLRWLGLEDLAVPASEGGLALEGALFATPEAVALNEAELRAAGTRARGRLAFVTGPTPRLELRAAIDRLSLDPWLGDPAASSLRHWLVAGPPSERELAFDLAVERLSWKALRAEKLRLEGELAQGRVMLAEASWADLGGSAGRLSGTIGPGAEVDLGLELAIPDPAPFVRALGADPAAVFFLDGPVSGRARLRRGERGPELSVELAGPDGRLRLGADLDPERLVPRTVHLAAAVEETRALLARLAPGEPPAPGFAGRSTLEAGSRRREDGTWTIEGRLALGRLAGRAELELVATSAEPLLRGRIALEGLDAATLGDLYRLAEPVLGLPRGPLSSWPGAWPRQRFGVPLLPPLDLDLALVLGLAHPDGTPLGSGGLRLASAGDTVALDEIDLPLARGRLGGRLWVELAPGAARLEGRLVLASAELALLASGLRAGEDVPGILDLELEARGAGGSLAEIAGNLEGGGRLVWRAPSAAGLASVLAEPEGLVLAGPFALARGVLRAPELALASARGGRARVRALFDLAAWILDLEIRPSEADGPALRLLGPPHALRRYERGSLPRRASRAPGLTPKARSWSRAARWSRTPRSSRARARVPLP
ncbi:MAG: hypothetical protein RMK73_00950 [Geminicoccaceae bacterium]|nr:hypothetical protein [Geminicoccaceae bacterium]